MIMPKLNHCEIKLSQSKKKIENVDRIKQAWPTRIRVRLNEHGDIKS